MDMQCNDFLIMHRYVLPHFCAFTLDVFIGFLYLFIVRPNTAVIETPFTLLLLAENWRKRMQIQSTHNQMLDVEISLAFTVK